MASGGNGIDGPVESGCVFLHEMADECGNVFTVITQRRNHDRKDFKPVVQVVPKAAVGHHLSQSSVRRCDDPDINTNGAHASQPFELVLLQQSQQLWLQL